MYNIFTEIMRNRPLWPNRNLFLSMKITFALILLLVLQARAYTNAQKVSLNVKNAPLKEVLGIISEQSGHNFLYHADEIDHTAKITLSIKNVPFKQALDRGFADQPVTYTIINNNVAIKKKSARAPGTEQAKVTISGVVTDEKGDPLPGATIILKGTSYSTATDSKGMYSFS